MITELSLACFIRSGQYIDGELYVEEEYSSMAYCWICAQKKVKDAEKDSNNYLGFCSEYLEDVLEKCSDCGKKLKSSLFVGCEDRVIDTEEQWDQAETDLKVLK